MARLLIALFFFIVATPCMAQEVRPLDVVKNSVEQALEILKSPEYSKTDANNKQRDKLWGIIQNVFDFSEMAKRTLAKNWKRFSPKEQTEFTELFSVFLRNIYLSKIQGGFEDERVEYREEVMLSESKAVVKTAIIRKDLEIPIDYSLQKESGAWKVYDVNVEGTRMVRNYRAQFAKILINGTPAELIEILKKKIEEQNKAGNNPDQDRSDIDLERLTTRLFTSLIYGSKNSSN